MATACLFRILSKPNFVLILHVDCLFAKNNLVLFQSYVALVLFSRTRSRKLNKISLRFPFSFFCMRLMVTWEAAFQSNCLCGPLAGLKVVTGAVSCSQDIFLISLLFQRENPHERGSWRKHWQQIFLREEDSGCGTKDGELENFNCRFYFLKNFTAAQWAGSWVDTAVIESKRSRAAHPLLHTSPSFQHPAISVQGFAFTLE